jgi:hypothetical protein
MLNVVLILFLIRLILVLLFPFREIVVDNRLLQWVCSHRAVQLLLQRVPCRRTAQYLLMGSRRFALPGRRAIPGKSSFFQCIRV